MNHPITFLPRPLGGGRGGWDAQIWQCNQHRLGYIIYGVCNCFITSKQRMFTGRWWVEEQQKDASFRTTTENHSVCTQKRWKVYRRTFCSRETSENKDVLIIFTVALGFNCILMFRRTPPHISGDDSALWKLHQRETLAVKIVIALSFFSFLSFFLSSFL